MRKRFWKLRATIVVFFFCLVALAICDRVDAQSEPQLECVAVARQQHLASLGDESALRWLRDGFQQTPWYAVASQGNVAWSEAWIGCYTEARERLWALQWPGQVDTYGMPTHPDEPSTLTVNIFVHEVNIAKATGQPYDMSWYRGTPWYALEKDRTAWDRAWVAAYDEVLAALSSVAGVESK